MKFYYDKMKFLKASSLEMEESIAYLLNNYTSFSKSKICAARIAEVTYNRAKEKL